MKEDLITFETAKLAKEKGFDEPCIDTYKDVELYRHKSKRYNSSFNQQWKEEPIKNSAMSNAKIPRYSAPTQSLLQKWLREVHEIIIYVIPSYIEDESLVYKCNGFDNYIQVQRQTYEEALEIGLQETLKLIKV